VAVDIETGIVTMNEMVAVRIALIIDLKTAESQVYGALIMGITYALFEKRFTTRRPDGCSLQTWSFYRLAASKTSANSRFTLMTGKGYDDRGGDCLGEPPVISPGAATLRQTPWQ